MATVNYTVEENAIEGWVKVQWAFSSSGEVSPFPNQDEGEPFNCTELAVDAMEASGDIGGSNDNGRIAVLASHPISPSTFREFFAITNTNFSQLHADLNLVRRKQVKPVYNRNNRAVTLTVLLRRTGC